VSETLERIKALVRVGDYRVSDHARRRLLQAGVREDEAIAGVAEAQVVEDYPQYPKGPCVLVLQHDDDNVPYHILWGTPMRFERPAAIITAYRPDADRWSKDLLRRL